MPVPGRALLTGRSSRGQETKPLPTLAVEMAPRSRNTPPSALHAPLLNLERALAAQARTAESYRRGTIPVSPTYIEAGPLSLLLSGSPRADTLDAYAAALVTHRVKHVVRLCEPLYDSSMLEKKGFIVHDLQFPDGEVPPERVVTAWLSLLDAIFDLDKAARTDSLSSSSYADLSKITESVAVHCAAGLGRAPVLLAVALIELGFDPFDAIAAIRTRRRGAINGPQMAFLLHYVPRRDQPRNSTKIRRPRSSSLLSSFITKGLKATRSRPLSRPNTPPSLKVPQSVLTLASASN